MPVSLLRCAAAVLVAASTAIATPALASPTGPQFTWQALTLPAGASDCTPGVASTRGTQYLLSCLSFPDDRHTTVVRDGQLRALADTVGQETFAQIYPLQVSDSGWVYGLVGHDATDETGGWRLARWTPAGALQLAPHAAETATHFDVGSITTSETYAHVRGVNERGDAVVDFRRLDGEKGSSWLWRADNSVTPVMPVNPGRWAEAVGIANDGTVVFNDREAGMDAFITPLPYRRLPSGVSEPLATPATVTSGVHGISPSGQRIVGRAVIRGDRNEPWIRWDAPAFAASTQAPMEESEGFASCVLDNGDAFTGVSVLRGTTETKLYSLLSSTVPTGTLTATDMLDNGRILATISPRDTSKPALVGWLVPAQS